MRLKILNWRIWSKAILIWGNNTIRIWIWIVKRSKGYAVPLPPLPYFYPTRIGLLILEYPGFLVCILSTGVLFLE